MERVHTVYCAYNMLRSCQHLLQVHGVLNGWACTHISGYVHKGHCMNDHNRSHAMPPVAWAYHLYLVAVGALPAVQVVMCKNFTLLVLLHFLLV